MFKVIGLIVISIFLSGCQSLSEVKNSQKSYLVEDNTEISHTTNNNLTPGMRVDNLQKNINGMGNFERQNRVNNIVKKWK